MDSLIKMAMSILSKADVIKEKLGIPFKPSRWFEANEEVPEKKVRDDKIPNLSLIGLVEYGNAAAARSAAAFRVSRRAVNRAEALEVEAKLFFLVRKGVGQMELVDHRMHNV